MNVGELAVFKTRTMTEIVRRFPRPNFVGKELFPERPVSGNTATWDVVSGARQLAKYVAQGGAAHVRPLQGRVRKSTELTLVKEKKTLDEATMNFLSRPGEFDQAYGDQAVADELEALDRNVEFRREATRWQALTTGTIDIRQSDPAINFLVDFSVLDTHKVSKTGTAKWTDATNSKPLDDILTWKRLIARDSGIGASRSYLNSYTMQLLVANSDVRDLLKYTIGDMLARNGYITMLGGVDLQPYDATYVDDGDVVRDFIPDGKFVVVAPDGLGKTFVGPTKVKGGKNVVGKFSYSYETDDPVDLWILTGVREIPIIQNPDQLLIATVN